MLTYPITRIFSAVLIFAFIWESRSLSASTQEPAPNKFLPINSTHENKTHKLEFHPDNSSSSSSSTNLGNIGKESESRACPYCTGPDCIGVSGYIFDPVVIFKVIVALVLGAILFFALLFSYKLWSFVDLPYETSPYFGPGSSSQSAYKPYGQARGFSTHSIITSLTETVLQALEKVY